MTLIGYFFSFLIFGQLTLADVNDSLFYEALIKLDKINNTSPSQCSSINSIAKFADSEITSKCAARDSFFRNISKNEMTIQQSIHWLSTQKTQVIILGENHHSPSFDFLPELIEGLISKDKAINCLLIEEESKFADSGELMSEGSTELDYYYAWKKSAAAAVKLGAKVYFIDDRNLPRENGNLLFYMDDPRAMELRNQSMSVRISQLISTGICSAAIAINGKEHLFDDFSENKYHSLQSLVRAKGISTRTVNLQDFFRPDFSDTARSKEGIFRRSTYADYSWNWIDCPQNSHRGREKVGFRNSSGDQVPFSYFSNKKISGYWSDFDLTILLP